MENKAVDEHIINIRKYVASKIEVPNILKEIFKPNQMEEKIKQLIADYNSELESTKKHLTKAQADVHEFIGMITIYEDSIEKLNNILKEINGSNL
jgi:nitrate/nitrite-specific signal transduction histidine kinase